jgi:hypothetical protein
MDKNSFENLFRNLSLTVPSMLLTKPEIKENFQEQDVAIKKYFRYSISRSYKVRGRWVSISQLLRMVLC